MNQVEPSGPAYDPSRAGQRIAQAVAQQLGNLGAEHGQVLEMLAVTQERLTAAENDNATLREEATRRDAELERLRGVNAQLEAALDDATTPAADDAPDEGVGTDGDED